MNFPTLSLIRAASILWIGTLAPLAHAAPAFELEPLRVTEARVDDAFAGVPSDQGMRDALRDLNLETDGPGLLLAPTDKLHELNSARRFGAALFAQFGYTLALISVVDRVDVPAFDGVVLDANFRVIANFSLKTKAHATNLTFEHGVALAKAEAYARPKHWGNHVLREARALVGLKGRAKKGEEVVIKSPGRQNAYLRREAAALKMIKIFGVGTGRPTWVLVDLAAAPALEWAEVEDLRASLSRNTGDARGYLYQTHGLTDVRPSAAAHYPPRLAPDLGCDELLMAAE